jgi:MATE family multidrug resistance protein
MKLINSTGFFSWFHIQGGLPYQRILKYFFPEWITALIVYFLPYFIDCLFICNLKSTSTYAVSGICDNFLTMFLKAAEGLPIGIVIIAGYFNGRDEFQKAGQAFVDAFWLVIAIGATLSAGLYFSVQFVCGFNNFSPEMIAQGIPYLQIKSLAIFFMFVYFSLVGFLRAIKNTFVPMIVFILGSIVFVVVDYILIFGKFGFPEMGLMGSATAALSQYVSMCIIMFVYLLFSKNNKIYQISLFNHSLSWNRSKNILLTSLPVVIDKVSIAFAYAWLGSCMSHLGAQAGAAFSCIKMMERFAFLPAIACAHIVTFLVSNDLGRGDWNSIYGNIKKIIIISALFVGAILIIGSLWPMWFVSFFDKNGDFGSMVGIIFPALSVLIMIDLLQLVLSASLRGVGDVNTVMITRVSVIGLFFIPATYVISYMTFSHMVYKMLVTYAAFLFGNGLMTIVYVYRLRQNHWKKQS